MSKVYRHSDGSWRDYPETNFPTLSGVYAPPWTKVIENYGVKPELKEEKKGLKFDDGKVPLDLIPYDALVEIGKVLQAGEKKYGTANWSNGIEMRRLLAAAMRHLGQFNNGEDLDEETQTLHLANAATNLMFAIWMYKNRPDLDNRWAKKDKK